MTPLLPLGLALALNATVLGAGTLWLRRQAKRVTAERAGEYRSLFKLDPLPPAGEEVQILVEDDDGRTSEIEGVHWPAIGWTDAVSMLRVEGDVLGWRRPPFRREPLVDYSGWSDEQVAAEMARRFGEDAGGCRLPNGRDARRAALTSTLAKGGSPVRRGCVSHLSDRTDLFPNACPVIVGRR